MTSRKIPIRVPQGARVSSDLYPDMELDDLTQNIVAVELPNGLMIEVGWFPEHDPRGSFCVRVTNGVGRGFGIRYENEESITDPYDVADLVGLLGERYSGEDGVILAKQVATEVTTEPDATEAGASTIILCTR